MIKEAIEKILEMGATQVLEIGGRNYTNKGVIPALDPTPATLEVETLTGLIDYIEANRDKVNFDDCIILVDDFSSVRLYSKLSGAFVKRDTYIIARNHRELPSFGRYMDIETAIVWLQARFLDEGHRAAILTLLGNVTDSKVMNYDDDGVTQSVTAKRGITKVENVAVPNPVSLTPYRTFIEAEQPPSNFVLRVRSGGADERPTVALFEADGGKWKLDAIHNIKTYLDAELDRIKQIIPVIA